MSTQFRFPTVKAMFEDDFTTTCSLLMHAVLDMLKEEVDVKYPQISKADRILAQAFALGYAEGCMKTARENGIENVDPLETYAQKYEDLLKTFVEKKEEENV